jgi:hypothetical protein
LGEPAHTARSSVVGRDGSVKDQVLDVDPLLELDVGGVPDPDGGVPLSELAPLPMFGQFLVVPELVPELVLFELDEGVVLEEPDTELVPELPVVVDVVAASATNAPPARSPEASAPTARTLRKRMCMALCPFVSLLHRPRVSRYCRGCAPDLWAAAESRARVQRVMRRTDEDAQELVEPATQAA